MPRQAVQQSSPSSRIRRRIAGFDWKSVRDGLDEGGYARLPGMLSAAECSALIQLYSEPRRFRSFVDLRAHGFGDHGDYRYFAHPLPPLVRALRFALYPRLAAIANRWREELAGGDRYPGRLSAFLAQCRTAGQSRPTPLLFRYDSGGYNRLHQDIYGAVAFPLQVVCLLSRPDEDFSGGEFLLTEQRPRMQSRGEAIALQRGESLVFPNCERPGRGARGPYRLTTRHGVSRVRSGERYALGIIFHDAK